MAVIQISQIQHRRGLHQDLPQLASGELGWALDSRRLYIGNGTPEEGAPVVGNTEILTEYSDILAGLDTYTYKGDAAGYTVETGPSSPVVRPVQAKLDDFVTSRDFGTQGDNLVDESVLLNRAISQLYLEASASDPRIRRTLIIPPGTYRLTSNSIRLLPNVKIKGAGKERTILIQYSAGLPVIHIADSKGQIGIGINGIGSNGATLPGNVEVEGLTLVHNGNGACLDIESAVNALFVDVGFRSSLANPTNSSSNTSEAIRIQSNVRLVEHIRFVRCDFKQTKFVVNTSADAEFLEFIDCKFNQHYRAFNLGDTSVLSKPQFIKIINSHFSDIGSCAIYAGDDVRGIFSCYNYFKNVGNNYGSSPVDPVVAYRENNCYSISDSFERTLTDDTLVPAVSYGAARVSLLNDLRGLSLGTHITGHGTVRTLASGATSLSTGIALTPNIESAFLNYTILRGTNKRTGVFRFSNGAVMSYDEDYVEDADVGVDLFMIMDSGAPTLYYTSTVTPDSPVIFVNVEHFKTYANAIPV